MIPSRSYHDTEAPGCYTFDVNKHMQSARRVCSTCGLEWPPFVADGDCDMRTEELFDEAEKLEKLGNRDEAFHLYTQFIEDACVRLKNLNDQNERMALQRKLGLAFNNRGFIRYQKVDFDKAVDDYTKGLSYDQQMHFTFYNRGLIRYRLGRYSEAIEDMKKALTIAPQFESAQQCLQQSHADMERGKTNIHM